LLHTPVSRHLPAMAKPDRRKIITGKLKTALNLMVWGDENNAPLEWDAAARTANLSTRSMRRALERPNVQAYLHGQKQVFRAAIGCKTLSRLAQLRDQDDNKNAAVAAAKTLEQLEDVAAGAPRVPTAPGFCIVVVDRGAPAVEHRSGVVIDAAPTASERQPADT
jgi:hypothetical protein